jgi:hypothetical protein
MTFNHLVAGSIPAALTMDNTNFIECFIKYQKTCIAYNNLLRENRMLKKKLLEKPKLTSRKDRKMSEEQLRELAYLKWEKAGRPPGDGVQFWLQAEAEASDCPKATKKACPAPTKVAAKTSSTPPTPRKK